jgi:hypothetical protein
MGKHNLWIHHDSNHSRALLSLHSSFQKEGSITMDSQKTKITVGSSFLDMLAVAFIVLKLIHVIDWSWWWVLSPLWIPLAIALLLVFLWAIATAYTK